MPNYQKLVPKTIRFYKKKFTELNYSTPVNLIKDKVSEFASIIKMSLEISNQNTLSIVSVRRKKSVL